MPNQQTVRELERLHRNTTTKVQRQQTRELFSTRKEVTRTQQQRIKDNKQESYLTLKKRSHERNRKDWKKVNKQESYLALKKRSHERNSKDAKSTNKRFIYHSKRGYTNATAKTHRQQTRDLFSSRKEVTRTQTRELTLAPKRRHRNTATKHRRPGTLSVADSHKLSIGPLCGIVWVAGTEASTLSSTYLSLNLASCSDLRIAWDWEEFRKCSDLGAGFVLLGMTLCGWQDVTNPISNYSLHF